MTIASASGSTGWDWNWFDTTAFLRDHTTVSTLRVWTQYGASGVPEAEHIAGQIPVLGLLVYLFVLD